MSEIQQQEHRNKRSGIRSKKLSTRVDLTPMVDLGFLLITFFIFTTTMNEPNACKLVVPDDRDLTQPVNKVAENKTISLILEGNDRICYYQGLNKDHWQLTNYSATGLRSVIQQKLAEVKLRFGKSSETVVLIKPTSEASYKNIVNILDEMLINDVKKYVLMEPSPQEAILGSSIAAGKSYFF